MNWRWFCVFATVGLLGLSACGTAEGDHDAWDLGEDTGATSDASSDAGGDTGRSDTDSDTDSDTGRDTGSDTDGNDGGGPGCLPSIPERHRAGAQTCDNVRDSTEPNHDPELTYAECAEHSDCTDGSNGRCTGNAHDGWRCTYDRCFEDSDCGDGGVCECGGGFRSDHNVCLSGNCQTDSDCGPNGYCSPSLGDCGHYSGVIGYFCHTCEDECVNDSDCEGEGEWGEPYCMYNQSVGHWVCSSAQCVG